MAADGSNVQEVAQWQAWQEATLELEAAEEAAARKEAVSLPSQTDYYRSNPDDKHFLLCSLHCLIVRPMVACSKGGGAAHQRNSKW